MVMIQKQELETRCTITIRPASTYTGLNVWEVPQCFTYAAKGDKFKCSLEGAALVS